MSVMVAPWNYWLSTGYFDQGLESRPAFKVAGRCFRGFEPTNKHVNKISRPGFETYIRSCIWCFPVLRCQGLPTIGMLSSAKIGFQIRPPCGLGMENTVPLVLAGKALIRQIVAFPARILCVLGLFFDGSASAFRRFYIDSTLILHWFYIDSTLILHWFYIDSTLILHWFYIIQMFHTTCMSSTSSQSSGRLAHHPCRRGFGCLAICHGNEALL